MASPNPRASSKAVATGADLVYTGDSPDHHRFNQQEILNTINRAKKRRAEVILTTQRCRAVRKSTGAICLSSTCAWKSRSSVAPRTSTIVSAKSVFADGNPPLLPRSHHCGRGPLPAPASAGLGRSASRRAGFILDKRHRTVARENIAAAFPEKSKHDVTQLARDHFQRLGETYACILQTGGMNAEQIQAIVTFEGYERLNRLQEDPEARIILAIGHYGNRVIFLDSPRSSCPTRYHLPRAPPATVNRTHATTPKSFRLPLFRAPHRRRAAQSCHENPAHRVGTVGRSKCRRSRPLAAGLRT